MAEVGERQGLAVQGPAATGVPLALLGQLTRECSALERLLPPSGKAVDVDQANLSPGLRKLVAVRKRFRPGPFEISPARSGSSQ